MARGEIGFVGLGIMGKPMVRNLMKADYSVTVYDIVAESVEELATDGAIAASSAAEVASNTTWGSIPDLRANTIASASAAILPATMI